MRTYSISVKGYENARIKVSGGFVLSRIVASVQRKHEGNLALYTYDNNPSAGIDPPSGITPVDTNTSSTATVKVGETLGVSLASTIAQFWLQPGMHDVLLPDEGIVIPDGLGLYISGQDIRYMNIYWSEPDE